MCKRATSWSHQKPPRSRVGRVALQAPAESVLRGRRGLRRRHSGRNGLRRRRETREEIAGLRSDFDGDGGGNNGRGGGRTGGGCGLGIGCTKLAALHRRIVGVVVGHPVAETCARAGRRVSAGACKSIATARVRRHGCSVRARRLELDCHARCPTRAIPVFLTRSRGLRATHIQAQ